MKGGTLMRVIALWCKGQPTPLLSHFVKTPLFGEGFFIMFFSRSP